MTKLLTKSKFLLVCAILTIILSLAGNVPYFFLEGYELFRFDCIAIIFDSICIIALLISFKKGSTNVQKTLLGALLYCSAYGTLENFLELLDLSGVGYELTFDVVVFAIFSLVDIGIFVSHIILQTDHKGSSKSIYAIYVFIVIMIITNTVYAVYSLKNGISFDSLFIINNIGCDFFFLTILCIEKRVQCYKEIRLKATEEGNWTPEAKAEAKKLFRL